jgi:crotonobetainyl-CoA:carnitine CoA-transferase CaiB-like acyl-CoA transferase
VPDVARKNAQMSSHPSPTSPIPLPLAGVRVLDLTRVLAGPYCGMILADMGAEVIKIENPDGGDESRGFLEPNWNGISTYFLSVNRNKRSVALDLKAPEGKAAFLKLVAQSDVVLENFRTGVMERLGLGWEALRGVRPGLVMCAISGYGRSGPNVEVPGYDPVAQAESGLMSVIGDPDGSPMRTGPSVIDVITGIFSAQAISAALRHVALTGEGRFIEATLHETALNMLFNFAGANLLAGLDPKRSGNSNQVAQPADLFTAADGEFVLAAVTDGQFRGVARAIGRPELGTDPRFAGKLGRLQRRVELKAILNEAFAADTRAGWVARLRAESVPSGMVASVAEALASDLVAARGSVREVEHPSGSYRALMPPVRLHGTAPVPAKGAPLLGADTRAVLRDIGGLSEAEIADMTAKGVARMG